MSDSETGNGENKGGMDRRAFLKAAGLVSGAAGAAGMGAFGYAAGTDPNSYLGWQNEEGASLVFNRKRYEVETPTYLKVGDTSRPDARVLQIFERRGRFMREFRPMMMSAPEGEVPAVTPEDFSEPLRSYYLERPQDLELDVLNMTELGPLQRADSEEYGDQFLLAEAWSAAMGAVGPGPISGPPEENDFPRARYGPAPQPVKLKDPAKTAELIKTISLQLGSTMVGITKLNPDWVYGYPIRGRGFENLEEPLEIPEWWTYAIVVGTPMS
jgi:epoxyqueuosine reductase